MLPLTPLVPNIQKLPVVSASKIKMYKTCGRKYYYRYVLPKEERPEDQNNIYALKGTALHAAIEKYYKKGDLQSALATYQETMLETMAKWQDTGIVVGEDQLPRALKDGKEMLKGISWQSMVPEHIEYRFSLPFPNVESPFVFVDGIIDMITKEGSVIDHKSNAKLPNMQELEHDPQFMIYRWAYKQIYGTYPWKVVWHHLKSGDKIELPFDNYEENFALLVHDVKEMVQRNFSTPPARRLMDAECKQCMFFKECYK